MTVIEELAAIWPEWQVEGQLGKGSFGVVYKAVRRDHNVESVAAIKTISIPADSAEIDTLRSEGMDDASAMVYLQGVVHDFIGEIQLMESLKGVQNIVNVEDYKVIEKTDGLGYRIFIRMELLTPFSAFLADRKLTEAEVIKLGCDICTALEICGQRNVIHRDIKPENIFINDFGHFKLGDFGIARKMENMAGGLSQKGTFNYMAPEVASSGNYDARVDTYSLGIVLYRLLNGNRLPFLEGNQLHSANERRMAVERRIRGEKLPAPCEASAAMAAVILKACAYNPKDRFASATEMREALLAVASGAAVSGGKKTATKKKSKAPGVIAAILAVAVLAGAAVVALPKLLKGSEDGEESLSGGKQPAGYEQEQDVDAESVLTEAEAMAAQGDYAGALALLESAAAEYPEEEDLQEQIQAQILLLSEQAKDAALAQADTLAKAGNYEAAAEVIQQAQNTYGDHEDYRSALETYAQAGGDAQGRKDLMDQAKEQADAGDYPAAIRTIENAIKTYGEDSELTGLLASYRETHSSAVISDANVLIQQGDYAGALELLNDCLKYCPENTTLIKMIETNTQLLESANAVAENNPNQNPEQPKTGAEINIVGGASKEEAVVIQREDIHHSSFSEEGRVDWYKVTTSGNYSAYSMELLNNSIDTTIYITLYDAYDKELGSTSANKGYTGYLDIALEANTEYWFKVSRYRYSDDKTGNYQFTFKELICDAGTEQAEAFYVALDTQYTKQMDARGMYDWYRFTTTKNYATYQFKLTNNSVDTTMYLTVFDEYNTELGSVSASKGGIKTLDLQLTAGKEYTIRISRYADDRRGFYQFSCNEMVCTAGLTQKDAFRLEFEKTHNLTVNTGFDQWYMFTFTEAGEYTINLTNNSVDTTMYLTIFDNLGTELNAISAGKTKSAEQVITVEKGDVLFIRITRYYTDRFGNYSITFTKE